VNIKTTLKLSVTSAALFAIATPVASPANAADDTLKSGNKNILTISGQVVRALWYGDDGQHEQLFNTSGATTNSRVRWVVSGTINEDVTAGALIEMDIPDSQAMGNANFNGNTGSTLGQDTGSDDGNWSIRHEYVWIAHKKFGKVSLGQTDAAANGNTEGSLSGVGGVSNTGGKVWAGGGIAFLDATTLSTGSDTGVTVGDVVTNNDFTSRTDVIRYDTPKFMGLGLAASLNGAGGGEIGARYSGKFGPVNVIALGGYSEVSATKAGPANDAIIGFSAAALHESGLNIAGTYSTLQAETGGTDNHFWSASGGYRAKIFKVGGTDFRVGFTRTIHAGTRGDQGETWGIDVEQNLDAVGATVTLVYRNYEYENKRAGHCATGECSIEDVDVFGIQTLFKF
jgi:hypothetical protein